MIVLRCKKCGNYDLEAGPFEAYCPICDKPKPLYELEFVDRKDISCPNQSIASTELDAKLPEKVI